MDRASIIAVAVIIFLVGVLFSPVLMRLLVLLFTDVKKEYAAALGGVETKYVKLLTEAKSLYDADTKSLSADLDKAHSDWAAEVAQLKSDLGDANNKVTVLKSLVVQGTPLPTGPAPAPPAPVRTKAQIAADLATTQATEAQLQADLANAIE